MGYKKYEDFIIINHYCSDNSDSDNSDENDDSTKPIKILNELTKSNNLNETNIKLKAEAINILANEENKELLENGEISISETSSLIIPINNNNNNNNFKSKINTFLETNKNNIVTCSLVCFGLGVLWYNKN
jgi:hypothetical protein